MSQNESKIVVMIVDDDDFIRRFVVTALERDGHSVLVAGSGEEGLAILREFAGIVHLVLADLYMKAGMNGLTFRERVLEERPDTPIVIMSGDTASGILEGIDTLQKPFTRGQLAERIHLSLKRN